MIIFTKKYEKIYRILQKYNSIWWQNSAWKVNWTLLDMFAFLIFVSLQMQNTHTISESQAETTMSDEPVVSV